MRLYFHRFKRCELETNAVRIYIHTRMYVGVGIYVSGDRYSTKTRGTEYTNEVPRSGLLQKIRRSDAILIPNRIA
jgi:hypothetical protein